MHCFRDAPSLHQFLSSCPSPELLRLIHDQLEVLTDFDDVPLGELAHFFILEPEDPIGVVELAVGRNLNRISVESCVSHCEWFELIIIISDDGFGYVIFIPKDIKDQALMVFCTMHAARTQENSP